MIRKLLLTVAVAVSALAPVAVVAPAYAIDILNPGSGPCNNPNAASKPELCNDNRAGSNNSPFIGPNGILTSAIQILAIIVGVAAVIIIIVEGLRMMLAGGDPGNISNARRGIVYALVGLVVALVAQATVALILNKL